MVLLCLWLCSTGFLICRSFCFRLAAAGRPYAVEISLRAPFERSAPRYENQNKTSNKAKDRSLWDGGSGAPHVRRQRKSRRWRLFADVSLRRGTGNFASLFLQKSIRPQPGPSFPREACGLRGGPLVRSRRAPFERSAPRYENQNKTSNKAKDRPYWDGQSWRAWRDSNPRPFGS